MHTIDAYRKPKGPNTLVSENEAADQLKLSIKTLRNARVYRSDFLPFVKLGSRVRYRQADIDALIEKSVRTSTTDKGGA